MIDIDPDDVVGFFHDPAGRFVIFSRAGMPAGFPLPWWAVCLDTGGDGIGILVRPSSAAPGDGWTAAELLRVAVARADVELVAGARPAACPGFLTLALRAHGVGADASGVTFAPGGEVADLPWSVASVRGHDLPFSADAAGMLEGVTLDQLLVVLDRLHQDWRGAPPAARRFVVRATTACACSERNHGARR